MASAISTGSIILVFVIVLIIMFILGLAVLLIIFWKDIQMKLHPEKWAFTTMVQLEDSIITDAVKKNDTLTYTFNGNDYYLFYPPIETKLEKKVTETEEEYKKRLDKYRHNAKSTVFRTGGVASFTFIEGNPWPVDFRDLKKGYSNTTRLQKEFSKIPLSQMVSSVDDNIFQDKKTIMFIVIIGLLLLILIFKSPKVVLDKTAIEAMKSPVLFFLPRIFTHNKK